MILLRQNKRDINFKNKSVMAGTKDELRQREKKLKQKISEVPEKHKAFWERQLKQLKKQLYGN